MRCFSGVVGGLRDATFRRSRRQVRTNKQHQLTAYTDLWQARKASMPSLPARYRQGARKAGHGRGKAGARKGRGRGHGSYVLSLMTRRE